VHFAKEYVPDGYTIESVCANWFDALVRSSDRYRPPFLEIDDTLTAVGEFEYNFDAIYQSFENHKIGFKMLINDRFYHKNVPDQSSELIGTSIHCNILDFASPRLIEELYVNYYTNFDSAIKSVLLSRQNINSGFLFFGEIPPLETGSRVFYFFTFKDPFSNRIEQIERNFFFCVGYNNLYLNNCEDNNN